MIMNKQISQEIAEQTSEFVVNLVDHIIGHDGNCKVKVHAIRPDCLGRVFKINGGAEYKVMGWNRKARKRPVITRRLDDGNEYVWSVAAVSKYLGVDAVRRPYGSE